MKKLKKRLLKVKGIEKLPGTQDDLIIILKELLKKEGA